MKFSYGATTIRITHATRPQLLQQVSQHFADGRGFALATINLDHLVKLRRDRDFRKAYAAQDMVVADGNPIVWLSALAGDRVGLMPGSDLVRPLVTAAAAAGRKVSMLGATAEALAAASSRFAAEIPGYLPGVLIAPPMGFDPEGPAAREALAQIRDQGPGLCLIALGAPKQEKFAALGRSLAPETGFASVGAGVEFISGHQSRAPAFVRAMAMEWAWRALSAPRRLMPRYAACAAILPGEALRAWRQRR